MIETEIFEGEDCTLDGAKDHALAKVNSFIKKLGMTPQDIIEYKTEVVAEDTTNTEDWEYLEYYKVRVTISYLTRERY